ncbi:BTAD domain-containing putative transcriptional regulator [Amycolatopsis pigmentata]|uniref:BTAD domain-containing putative transcriptional regulator n=1 Tax=Amycolatopsis pigmentata TaxID=450801 RepID=A0ABW5FU88_9PSEU
MRVSLLGPVLLTSGDGATIEVGGARLRMLLARLALEPGRPVGVDSLVNGLWGTEPPADAINALQSLVSRLRKVLGDAGLLVSVNGGYALQVRPPDVDVHRFEELAARGRRDLTSGRYAEAAAVLTEALGLWRGEALADVLDAPFAQPPATRLADLKAAAIQDRFEAELELGHHTEILADLEAAGAAEPLRERLAGLRMRALCAVGRQSDALGVYERVRADLAGELGVDPSAELQQLHLAVVRGELSRVPVTRPETLPAPLTSFVGRSQELALIQQSLGSARLVTLVGPGGAGKTRLATEAATRHPAHERGRIWFVGFAAVRDPGDVSTAVLGALGSMDPPLVTAPIGETVHALDRITESLRGGEALLVLDNCEHLIGAIAQLAHDLLTRVPALSVLATSREPLAITGEVLCQVGPMSTPEAIRLFTERAATVRADFTLDGKTGDAVTEICRRLDGMPLALELAAARLRSMSVAQIAHRLDDRFRLLTSGSRTALPRQRTLRAVVEWSWDLLEKPDRILARRLSVFPGGATLSAIEAICADESLPAEDVVYVLGSLVEKSFVDISGDRYRMLETLRVFGEERLGEAGERELLIERFGAFFLAVAEENEPALRTRDQVTAIATFDAEHDNMLAALHGAIERGDAATAFRLVQALVWYWTAVRGFHEQVTELVDQVLPLDGDVPAWCRATLRAFWCLFSGFAGFVDRFPPREVIDDCHRSDAMDHYPPLALVLPGLALFAEEPDLVDRERRKAFAHPDSWTRGAAHWFDGLLARNNGELDRADRAWEAALSGFHAVGDRWGSSMSLAMLAELRSLRNEHEKAIEAITQGLEMARELGSADTFVQHRCLLAGERMRTGDFAGARRDLDEAVRWAEEGGRAELAGMAVFMSLELARRAGDLVEAHRVLDRLEARSSGWRLPDRVTAEWLATGAAALAVSEGDVVEARARIPVALRSTVDRRDLADGAKVAESAARLFRLEGRPERSAWALGVSQSLRGVFDLGDPELRDLVTELRKELGEQAYQDAYRRGSSLPRSDAASLLLAEFTGPLGNAVPVGPHGQREEHHDEAGQPSQPAE